MGLNPSETKNNFENSYLKSSIFAFVKNKPFYNIPIKIKMFCNRNNIGLNFVPILGSACFKSKLTEKIEYSPK